MELTDILKLKLTGDIACFKKFYSNKSSLTYRSIPRSVIIGILASVLEIERNKYYDIFSEENAKIGINVETPTKTFFQCMNYLKKDGGRTQTRLQLLKSKDSKLEFTIYLAFKKDKINQKKLDVLEKKVLEGDLGFGVYLGQRQFKGYLELSKRISNFKIIKNFNGKLDSLTYKENIIQLDYDGCNNLALDTMPVNFSQEIDKKTGEILRLPEAHREVIYDLDGESMLGEFKEVVKISDNKYISFFSEVV